MNEGAASFPWLARMLQVGDSAFPTGGYAHSFGFEEVVRSEPVRDPAAMIAYLENHVWPMLVHLELPVVRFAHAAAGEGNDAELLNLDAEMEALKTARELREASRAMGLRRLHALQLTCPSPVLETFARAREDGRAEGHHAVVFGAGMAALPLEAALTSWVFQTMSGLCLSAPKLLRIGQDAAQRILTAALSRLEENVALSLAVQREELGWFDPFVEIASMQHEIAAERLFIS